MNINLAAGSTLPPGRERRNMRALFANLIGLATSVLLQLVVTTASSAAPFAYIPNKGSNNVSVIDTATNLVTARIPVGKEPEGVAVNASGTRVYVTNEGSSTVSVIDTAINAVIATIPTGATWLAGIAVNPAGTRVYVANHASSSVTVIDAVANTVFATIPVMVGPRGVVVDSTGERVYVSSQNGGEISVIDAASNAVIKRLSVPGAYGIALSPGGTRLYATNIVDWRVHVFDTSTYAQVGSVKLGGTPYAVSVDPTGTRVYVTNFSSNSVTVLDGHTAQVVATVVIGLFPYGVSVHPSNGLVYVANAGSNMVALLDSRTLSVLRKIPVDDAPYAFGRFLVGPKALQPIEVVEFYNASLDHYFISWRTEEIALLDTGIELKGWTRTGHTFRAYAEALAATSAVCRYYIPPSLGDSHFFGRGFDECAATGDSNPSFVLEDGAFMHMILPSAGVCPATTTPVYRVFSNRADANHRYMTSAELREQMAAIGWLREGDGPDFVVMCAP